MNNELETTGTHRAPVPIGERGIVISDMDGLARFAACVARSGFAPKGLQTPEAIAIAVQMGLELGMSPMSALQNIAVINGRPGVFGDAALGMVKASGLLESIEEKISGTGEGMVAACTTKRKGDRAEKTTTFSVYQAKRARLWGKQGPWADYPERMLMFRARGFNLRDNFPDVLKGFKTVEELQDYTEPKPVNGKPTSPDRPAPVPSIEFINDEQCLEIVNLLKTGKENCRSFWTEFAVKQVGKLPLARFEEAKAWLLVKQPATPEAHDREPGVDVEEPEPEIVE